MSNRNKPAQAEEEGSPAWMTTYSDMVTLLLAFFVLLFSFSTIDAQKWEEIVSSLSGTPFVAIQALDPGGTLPESVEIDDLEPTPTPAPSNVIEGEEASANSQEVAEKFNELYEKIQAHIEENDLQAKLQVVEYDDTIILRMTNQALFASGEIDIEPEAKLILTEICGILNDYVDLIQQIDVEGHTDTVPMNSAIYKNNWHLSAGRAAEVVTFCEEILDIDGAKIKGVCMGEYHPIASNDTEEGKKQNRRVEFVIESINKE